MAKKQQGPNPLLAAIARAAEQPKIEPTRSVPASEGSSLVPKKQEKNARPAMRRSGRSGMRLIAGHFDPAVARQLRLLAAEEDTTIQALLAEALDLLFVKKGKGKLTSVVTHVQGDKG